MERRDSPDAPEPPDEQRSSRVRPLLAAALLLAVAIAFGILIARELAFAPAPVEIQLPPAEPTAGAVSVHVGGAVLNPGVYSLPSGSRVVDAVQQAGGFRDGADTDAPNLAEELDDGSSYIVPLHESDAPESSTVIVHVWGEAQEPGLYELPSGSRLTHALAAAGGATESANLSDLNFAEILEDGMRYSIPRLTEAQSETVFVHIVGAIERPGTYTAPGGARLIDVIEMAGGVTSGADINAVELALRLEDGQRYYIPHMGEEIVGDVTVHLAGAVVRPGLYTLPSGARVIDALEAAGGTLSRADMHALNLAEPVRDGARYAVPVLRATVNINIAGVTELDSIPGISRNVALAIVNHREASGAFTDVEQLLDVSGIGPSTMAAIRPYVSVT